MSEARVIVKNVNEDLYSYVLLAQNDLSQLGDQISFIEISATLVDDSIKYENDIEQSLSTISESTSTNIIESSKISEPQKRSTKILAKDIKPKKTRKRCVNKAPISLDYVSNKSSTNRMSTRLQREINRLSNEKSNQETQKRTVHTMNDVPNCPGDTSKHDEYVRLLEPTENRVQNLHEEECVLDYLPSIYNEKIIDDDMVEISPSPTFSNTLAFFTEDPKPSNFRFEDTEVLYYELETEECILSRIPSLDVAAYEEVVSEIESSSEFISPLHSMEVPSLILERCPLIDAMALNGVSMVSACPNMLDFIATSSKVMKLVLTPVIRESRSLRFFKPN
ncbi:hypothetical protein HDE_13746 [Halotydeus destructor]|nr:hypothetical protein HDE_13746 [Halotydeus destructor]